MPPLVPRRFATGQGAVVSARRAFSPHASDIVSYGTDMTILGFRRSLPAIKMLSGVNVRWLEPRARTCSAPNCSSAASIVRWSCALISAPRLFAVRDGIVLGTALRWRLVRTRTVLVITGNADFPHVQLVGSTTGSTLAIRVLAE